MIRSWCSRSVAPVPAQAFQVPVQSPTTFSPQLPEAVFLNPACCHSSAQICQWLLYACRVKAQPFSLAFKAFGDLASADLSSFLHLYLPKHVLTCFIWPSATQSSGFSSPPPISLPKVPRLGQDPVSVPTFIFDPLCPTSYTMFNMLLQNLPPSVVQELPRMGPSSHYLLQGSSTDALHKLTPFNPHTNTIRQV